MKILTIMGTRPEVIKLAPVLYEISRHPALVSRICVTGQHREMLDPMLRMFQIKPNYDLKLMKENQSPLEFLSKAVKSLEAVLRRERPDFVLVQGDTSTALAGALSAFYLNIGVGHVEAGLRSFDMKDPFPEEMHRRQIDMVSDYYFAPTLLSKKNLVLERQPLDRITITGNTGIDVLIAMQKKLANDLRSNEIARMFYHNYKIWNNCKKVILITCHRRESFGDRFESICIGLKEIAKKNPLTDLVFPIHLNPSIKEAAHRLLQDIPNMHLLPPLDYQSFLWLMNRAHFILTDSGGIQEEAPYLGKPVLVMRNTTERVEAIEAGVSKLVGTDSHSIATEAQKLLDDDETYQTMAKIRHLFGDGQASKRIVQVLSDIGS